MRYSEAWAPSSGDFGRQGGERLHAPACNGAGHQGAERRRLGHKRLRGADHGLTYKENVPDTRESLAREMVKISKELQAGPLQV